MYMLCIFWMIKRRIKLKRSMYILLKLDLPYNGILQSFTYLIRTYSEKGNSFLILDFTSIRWYYQRYIVFPSAVIDSLRVQIINLETSVCTSIYSHNSRMKVRYNEGRRRNYIFVTRPILAKPKR